MNVKLATCICGRVLGERREDGSFESKHQGRRILVSGDADVVITCDRCGRLNAVRLDKKETLAVA